MPSYADEMAARHPSPTVSRGPVRLWISRGEVKRDARGREYVDEIWEEEEIMDTDVVDVISDVELNGNKGIVNDNVTSNLSSLIGQGGALLVLDTNVLIDSLPFCITIFTQCLARNAHALSMGKFTISPLSLILSEVVVSELDNLKIRSQTREKAQRANRWILEAVLQQKKRSYSILDQVDNYGQPLQESIPERAWALHIENYKHHLETQNDPTYSNATPDEEIVSLCRILQRNTGQMVWLCSNDINAQLRAESEGLHTFSPSKWIKEEIGQMSTEGRDEKLSKAISGMIDQWSSQMGIEFANLAGNSSSPTEYQMHSEPMSEITIEQQSLANPFFSESKRVQTQGISDSIYAVNPDRMNTEFYPRRSERLRNGSRITSQSASFTHQYSANDRSSASSMWASRQN